MLGGRPVRAATTGRDRGGGVKPWHTTMAPAPMCCYLLPLRWQADRDARELTATCATWPTCARSWWSTGRRTTAGRRTAPQAYVRRQPPNARDFTGQRVRQAYDSLGQPLRLAAELALMPALLFAAATPALRSARRSGRRGSWAGGGRQAPTAGRDGISAGDHLASARLGGRAVDLQLGCCDLPSPGRRRLCRPAAEARRYPRLDLAPRRAHPARRQERETGPAGATRHRTA